MDNNEMFIEIAKRKVIINKLQKEVDEYENEIRKTFDVDVMNFFITKGYEIVENKYRRSIKKFINLRQIDKNNTFNLNCEPTYHITGVNRLIIKFEWKLTKNSNFSKVFWHPEEQSLEDFYNRRLKKVLILPIKEERKRKINNIINNQDDK